MSREKKRGSERESASTSRAPVRPTGQDEVRSTLVPKTQPRNLLEKRARASRSTLGRRSDSEVSSSSARMRAWKGSGSAPTSELTRDLTGRFLKLKECLQGKGLVNDLSPHMVSAHCPCCLSSRKISWADDHGSPRCTSRQIGEVPSLASWGKRRVA